MSNPVERQLVDRIHTQELKDKSTHESYQVQTESFLRESVREKNSDLSSVYEKSQAHVKNEGIAIQMSIGRHKKRP